MAGIPNRFVLPIQTLANYNGLDLAQGTGIQTFYAGQAQSSYLLSPTPFYSQNVGNVVSFTAAGSAVSEKKIDTDYDVQFNRPTVVFGKTVINVPAGITGVNGQNYTVFIKVLVRKWTGSVESEIVSATATSRTFTPINSSFNSFAEALPVTIPLTLFKAGEYLRLTVEFNVASDGANATVVVIGQDPQSRQYSAAGEFNGIGSRLTFQVPVKINL